MPNVNLSDSEWQQIMTILGDQPWKIAHPLLMRIGGQLQAVARASGEKSEQPPMLGPMSEAEYDKLKRAANAGGKEVRHE